MPQRYTARDGTLVRLKFGGQSVVTIAILNIMYHAGTKFSRLVKFAIKKGTLIEWRSKKHYHPTSERIILHTELAGRTPPLKCCNCGMSATFTMISNHVWSIRSALVDFQLDIIAWVQDLAGAADGPIVKGIVDEDTSLGSKHLEHV